MPRKVRCLDYYYRVRYKDNGLKKIIVEGIGTLDIHSRKIV